MRKILMLIGILSILASNANAWVTDYGWVTVTDSGMVVSVKNWCGWPGWYKSHKDTGIF